MPGGKKSNSPIDGIKRLISGRKPSRSGSSPTAASSTSSGGFLAAPQHEHAYTSPSSPTRRPDRPGLNAFSTPSNEPPPAYSLTAHSAKSPDVPAARMSFGGAQNIVAQTADDHYHFLTQIDTVFLIDDSGSMAGRSWPETAKALATITPICTSRDADGIDIYFLNAPDRDEHHNIKDAEQVSRIFDRVQPSGGTPTGRRLRNIIRPYLTKLETDGEDRTKPINIIVITDGVPTDDVEQEIITIAKKLDKLEAPSSQLGIQMLQVGREPDARKHLKQLDDDISAREDIRDIVDTVPFSGSQNEELTADGILKVVLGSVVRRLDRNSTEIHQRR
ncbi:hypothetical protein K491DRAFT_701856 [Lophiostoma macrostomum CBS 122681]|uniref:VWFA domain-containing protein n=1 Tax=Lophiostoma macrostomum CBS 122681 TaxID=1314788 RepID=A0A6A6TM98_9PLEO|nr:hypothetical protein K491DRAFT_701856 [Lophiostoma macrostomum CBS 122681]